MIYFFLYPFKALYTFSLPFPFFLYPAAQGMYQSFRTKIQLIDVSDRTAWSTART